MNGTGFVYDPMIGPISTLTSKPEPTFDQKLAFANAVAQHFKNTLFGRSYVNPYSHNIGEAARQMGMMEGSVMNQGLPWMMGEVQDVFHGSPFKFSKFSTKNIGTGEGAQAFGWGLYFTDERAIAEHYAKRIADNEYYRVIDKLKETYSITNNMDVNRLAQSVLDKQVLQGNRAFFSKRVEDFEKGRSRIGTTEKEYESWKKSLNALDDIQSGNFKWNKPESNLYKVTLHKGKDPSEYTWLDWDEPISSEQSKKINQYLKNKFDTRTAKIYSESLSDIEGTPKTGKEVYRGLSYHLGDRDTSFLLLEAGINGIRYPAGSLSGVKSSAKNYVVFDENAITIEEMSGF